MKTDSTTPVPEGIEGPEAFRWLDEEMTQILSVWHSTLMRTLFYWNISTPPQEEALNICPNLRTLQDYAGWQSAQSQPETPPHPPFPPLASPTTALWRWN